MPNDLPFELSKPDIYYPMFENTGTIDTSTYVQRNKAKMYHVFYDYR